MAENTTGFGSIRQPLSVGFFSHSHRMTETEIKTTLRENLVALLVSLGKPGTQHELGQRPGLSVGTAGRLMSGETDVRIGSVLAAAKAFGVEPWQLLVPRLDPAALPTLDTPGNKWPFDESLYFRLMALSPKSRYIIEGRIEEAISQREGMENQRAVM